MKKLIPFLLLIFLIVSCTSGSSVSDDTNADATLVSKIVKTDESGAETGMINYTYDGMKFKIISGPSNYSRQFYYTGNLITKIETYYSGGLTNLSTFDYDSSGRLIQAKSESVGGGPIQIFRDTYAYNSDHTIALMHYSNLDNGFDPIPGEHLDATSKYFLDANNEVAKIEDYSTAGTEITTFTQDDKHNPFKNVTGLSKLLQAYTGINFNVVAIDHSGYNEENLDDQIKVITYNAHDYPLAIHSQGGISTDHYYY